MNEVGIFLLAIIAYLLYSIYKIVANQHDVGRDYSRYPVFDHEQIKEAEKEVRSLSKEYREHIDKVTEMGKKERKVKYNKDYSDGYKAMFRKTFEFNEDENHKRKVYHFLIEGNMAVLNGQKKVQEILDEYFDGIAFKWDRFGQAEKNYSKWLNEKA